MLISMGLTTFCSPPFFSQLPYVSNVQVEPIVIQIDKLDLVLEENSESDASSGPNR